MRALYENKWREWGGGAGWSAVVLSSCVHGVCLCVCLCVCVCADVENSCVVVITIVAVKVVVLKK